ncbi:hypothetical protein ACLB2K_028557 [Fragaria x ananassa]
MCPTIYPEELKHLSRWVVESRLDKLKFARQNLALCYFPAAGILFTPELSDAQELTNLIQLVEKWDVNPRADSCSENVEIIFSAIKSTVGETGINAFARQDRSVTNHVIEIWLDLLKALLKEAEWVINKSAPTMED